MINSAPGGNDVEVIQIRKPHLSQKVKGTMCNKKVQFNKYI